MPTLNTKPSAVTVYPDRARITRAGTLSLEPGAQTIIIAPLPSNLDESSLRAAGKGDARLTGVQCGRQQLIEPAPGAAQKAQDKLQTLLDQDKILSDEEEAWKHRLGVVRTIGEQGGENLSRALARGKLSLENLTGVLDYLSQSHEAANNILRELAVRRRELAKEIQAAKQEADKLRNAAARDTYQAQVNLDVRTAGEVEIELTYTVYGASWNALYDARLDGEKLEWNYLAQVRQQTGENWDLPYTLTLSTATLSTGLDKPELPPWRVDAYRPPEPRAQIMRMAATPGGAQMAEMAAPAPAAAPLQAMAYDAAVVESSGPSVTYRIATPRAIPADGEAHQVAITTVQTQANIDYFCAPKVDGHAFVRAQFVNPTDYLMLAGQVNLYHGADFVGTRRVETIVPKQEVEFFLGAEERLHVERKEIKRSVDKSLLGNTGRTALAYHITIQNPALEQAKLTVLDQIPVSAHPDIRVKPGRITPETAPNDRGELEWQITLKRGEQANFEFEVTVEYPKELRVVGL
ncbi:MAG: mucoidy inhibitor MuiA family protein [Anaerolineae bacterium]|nr:mucoidy inhibitor MuiA family protein [Anaerolineae bacterium]